jgi:hypothetical protein
MPFWHPSGCGSAPSAASLPSTRSWKIVPLDTRIRFLRAPQQRNLQTTADPGHCPMSRSIASTVM